MNTDRTIYLGSNLVGSICYGLHVQHVQIRNKSINGVCAIDIVRRIYFLDAINTRVSIDRSYCSV